MLNLKNPKTQSILEAVIGSFAGMIVALAWNGFIDSVLVPLRAKFAFLGVIGYLIYAIIITFIAIFIVTSYVHIMEKTSDKETEDN